MAPRVKGPMQAILEANNAQRAIDKAARDVRTKERAAAAVTRDATVAAAYKAEADAAIKANLLLAAGTGTGSSITTVGTKTDSGVANLQGQFNDFLTAQNVANAATNLAKFQKRESAISVMTERLNKYNLGSLVNVMVGLAQEDASEDTIMLKLQETPEYIERFKANKKRIANNLAVLSPKEYLDTEDAYRQSLRAYGQKKFDTDAYVTQFLENDMAPNELISRLDTAVNRVANGDPDTTRQLREYGLSDEDLVGYMLDPKQSLIDINRKVATAEIGAAGYKNKINVSADRAGLLAAQGVTQAQAQEGYSSIAGILPDVERLTNIYGKTQEGYNLRSGEDEVFNKLASAKRAREALISTERNTFGGSSGRGRTKDSTDGQL